MVLSLPIAREIHRKPVRGVELWPAELRRVRRYAARISPVPILPAFESRHAVFYPGTADIHVKIGHRVKSKPRLPDLLLA